MKIITKPSDNIDESNIFVNDKYVGFKSQKTGNIYLQKCCQCNSENYALAVPTGICAFCNFNIRSLEEN
jgi:hypothetical protein